MSFSGIIKNVVKETVLIPVNVVREVEEAIDEVVDPKEEKKK